MIPLDVDQATKTVDIDPRRTVGPYNRRLFTRKVRRKRRGIRRHALENGQFSPTREARNAASRFNVFDIIWLLTGGGPADSTTTLPILIYRTAFKGYRLSEAAAMSVVATLLLMGLALLAVWRLAPREEGA